MQCRRLNPVLSARLRILPALLAAAMLVVSIAAAPVAAQPRVGANVPSRAAAAEPAVLRTTNYEIICEDGPEMASFIGQYMEQLFVAFTQRIGRVRTSTRTMPRLKVYIASSAASFEKLVGSEFTNSAGIYDPAQQRIVARSDGPLERTLRVLRHEGCHQFVSQYINRRMPIWIDEGLAVFFEEADLCGTRLEMGGAPAARVQLLQKALAENKLHPLEEILQMDHKSWTALIQSDIQQSRLLYCEVWSLVHFLVFADDGAYRPAMDRYLAAMAQGRSPVIAQREAFGDVARFSQKWHEYIKVMKPSEAAICRRNLRVMAELLPMVWNELPAKPTAQQFKDHLLNRPQGAVILSDPQLGRFSTRDTAAVHNLMRCPDDKSVNADLSYSFFYPNAAAGDVSITEAADMGRTLPQIVCTHHDKTSHRLLFAYDPRIKKIRHEIRIEPGGGR